MSESTNEKVEEKPRLSGGSFVIAYKKLVAYIAKIRNKKTDEKSK